MNQRKNEKWKEVNKVEHRKAQHRGNKVESNRGYIVNWEHWHNDRLKVRVRVSPVRTGTEPKPSARLCLQSANAATANAALAFSSDAGRLSCMREAGLSLESLQERPSAYYQGASTVILVEVAMQSSIVPVASPTTSSHTTTDSSPAAVT